MSLSNASQYSEGCEILGVSVYVATVALSRGSMLKCNYFKEFETRAAAIGRPSYFFYFRHGSIME